MHIFTRPPLNPSGNEEVGRRPFRGLVLSQHFT